MVGPRMLRWMLPALMGVAWSFGAMAQGAATEESGARGSRTGDAGAADPSGSRPDARRETDADRAAKSRARSLALQGRAAFERGELARALDLFTRAEALHHAPTLLLVIGQTHERLGQTAEALEAYERIVEEPLDEDAPKLFRDALVEAQRRRSELRRTVPVLTLKVEPTDARVSLDGVELPARTASKPRRVNPGEHRIEATANGYEPARRVVRVDTGQQRTVQITLRLLPRKAGPGPRGAPGDGDRGAVQRAVGWVAFGLGAAGLVGGAVAGGLAIGADSSVDDLCPDADVGLCTDAAAESDIDRRRRSARAATGLFVIGSAGVAAGVALLLTAPSSSPASRDTGVTVCGGPFFIGACGRF